MKVYYNGNYKVIDDKGNENVYKYLNNIPDYWNKITEIEIKGGVSKIEKEAFSGCKALKSVIIPEGVKEIGPRAFANCESLEKNRPSKKYCKNRIQCFYKLIDKINNIANKCN